MQRPLAVLRPSIANAILPQFLKNLSWSFLATLAAFAVLSIFRLFNVMGWFGMGAVPFMLGIVALWLLLALIPLLIRIIYLSNVTYHFYPSHLLSEFRFLSVKRFSIPYSQIVNVSVNVSLWDRLTGNGDMIIHSAENNAPDMYLYSVRNPEKVEQWLYSMIQRQRAGFAGAPPHHAQHPHQAARPHPQAQHPQKK
ncbi:PH domain-containing protein [Candidatus Woesearchaeota archaeon]|nr:PH domain-containing protein [Candidatus Woesearchaeota archaeon]